MNKKDRRHSGRVSEKSIIKAKRKEIIDECLEPQVYYSEWDNYRDGMRDFCRDKTKTKKLCTCWFCRGTMKNEALKWKKKITKQLKIRKTRQNVKV